jgi:hypothetical protein
VKKAQVRKAKDAFRQRFQTGPALRIAPLLSPLALLGAPWAGPKSLAASFESALANTP